jgi:acetolactate decarboxylase
MLSRRRLLHSALAGTGCTACAALAAGVPSRPARAADVPSLVEGPGYALRFVGSQREAIMLGLRDARLDLRTLQGHSHLYGLGPIEGLRGEVTIVDGRPSLARVASDGGVRVEESFDAGVPFFVWAEVSDGWRGVPVPDGVRSYAELEAFVGEAGRAAGLTRAFPFTVTGVPARVDLHVVNLAPGAPPGMAVHGEGQANIALSGRQATLVGFWSAEHAAVFTPMDSRVHIHVQSAGNDMSGHVDRVDLAGGGMVLGLPASA